MRTKSILFVLLAGGSLAARGADVENPPKNELAFQLGGLAPVSRASSRDRVHLGSGVALQVNYGHIIAGGARAALYYEVHLLANPLRNVSSDNGEATRDASSLFLTPGIRLKLRPTSRVSPYFAVGGGLAWFEHSTELLNGDPNPVGRELLRGALDFGAGVDVPVWRFLALRGKIRDFFTGSPNYNVASIQGAQNNVVAGAAFVVRWH